MVSLGDSESETLLTLSISDNIQVLANEYNAISLVIGYWTHAVPQWGWILIFWSLFLVLSNLGVLAYGEMEFWLSVYIGDHPTFNP